jgi:hypothetical protein
VFSFPSGSFNPVIADPTALYLTGYADLFQLVPRRRAAAKTARHTKAARH